MSKIYGVLNQPPAFFTTPREKGRESSGTIFWRSLLRMKKHERDRIARRLDWLQDVLSYLEEFMELPPVHLPAPQYLPGDNDTIEDAANLVRKQWGLGRGPIPDVVGLLEANGVVVVREPTYADGMDAVSRWQVGRPAVLLGADKDSAVRSRWDAAHELGHLVLHSGVDVDSRVLARLEAEANRFAGAFLLPADSFAREVTSSSIEAFKSLKKRWKVSIAAMIYRAKDLGILIPIKSSTSGAREQRRAGQRTSHLMQKYQRSGQSFSHTSLSRYWKMNFRAGRIFKIGHYSASTISSNYAGLIPERSIRPWLDFPRGRTPD